MSPLSLHPLKRRDMKSSNQKQPAGPGSSGVYGTQLPGTFEPSRPEESDAHNPSPSPGGAFGTQIAPPPTADGRPLPNQQSIRNVTRTLGADSADLNLIADIAGNKTKTGAQNTVSERRSTHQPRQESEIPSETIIESFDARHPPSGMPGKSTWNLRIRQRGIAGHISGIINELPASDSEAVGLKSAFANDSTPEYEVIDQLGAGNMGIVYRAKQTSLNRHLAIKTLKPDSPNIDHDQAMFVSEAVVTANLVHPNIVPIHDLGRTDDGKLFYSMKHVTGTAWNESIREYPLEQNLDIFLKLCDAVGFAHSRGVINRDLKPENVIVGDYGEVMVLDWGLAITNERFAQNDSVIVEFRGGAGTPVYMAPELADQDIRSIGTHSDIYLLGAILYEVLEGFPPHLLKSTWGMTDPDQQLASVVNAVLENHIEPDIRSTGELMQIARKAMSTFPADRHQSVEELQEAIREYRITGRAEELMLQVESKRTDSYESYQSAIALYHEALRKWPNNRRAQDGDRTARLAYAELAYRKGDVDLGLQILPNEDDRRFATVRSKLKRTRRIRGVIRATWGLATITTAVLLVVSTLLYFRAENDKQKAEIAFQELEQQNGTIQKLESQADLLTKTAEDKIALAKQAAAEAEKAQNDAMVAAAAAQEATERAATVRKELDAAAASLTTTKSELEAARKLTVDAKKQEEEANQKLIMANTQAKLAEAKLIDATAKVAQAKAEAVKAEFNGLIERIDAKEDAKRYDEMLPLLEKALKLAESNEFISDGAVRTFQKRLKANAKKLQTNRGLPNTAKFSSVAFSPNANSMLTASDKILTLRSNVAEQLNGESADQTFSVTDGKVSAVAVSNNATAFCAVGKGVKSAWVQSGNRYEQLTLDSYFPKSNISGAPLPFGYCFFSADASHLILVGTDKQVTVQIYEISENGAKLKLQQEMLDPDMGLFRADDVALMRDDSALLIAYNNECRAFPIQWTAEGVTIEPRNGQVQDKVYPRLRGLDNGDSRFGPGQLALSPDGSLLALISGSRLIVLPRDPDSGGGHFPYLGPEQIGDINELLISCEYGKVRDVVISHDNSRMVTAQDRYLQVWDRSGSTFQLTEVNGLYNKHSLAGHAETVIQACFLDQSNRHLISAATDNSIRAWDIVAYADFAAEMKQLVGQLRQTRAAYRQRYQSSASQNAAGLSLALKTQSDMEKDGDFERPTSRYLMTSAPAQPPTETALRFRQGRRVFSAEFSQDGSRLVVGSNDLAAHTFNSQTGQKTLTASMQSPRDLFFSPDRNNFLEGHIPEIVSIQFLPPDGELLLTSDYFGSVSAWDAKDDEDGIGFEKSRLLPEEPSCEISVSRDGKWLIAGGVRNDGVKNLADSKDEYFAVIWKTDDILNSSAPVPHMLLRDQHPFQVTAAAFSPNATLAVTAGRRGKFVVWDVMTGNVVATAFNGHKADGVSGVFFSKEDEFISSGFDGNVFQWKIQGDRLIATKIERPDEKETPDFIVRLRPSPDGSGFITSDLTKDFKERSYELKLNYWSEATGWIRLPFSISASEDLEKPYRHDISWSTDGREVLYVHDEGIYVLDSSTWKVTGARKLPMASRAIRGAFAPSVDGKKCVATFDGRFAHLWDLDSGEHLAEFRSHASRVTASFSSDQQFVVTGSESVRVFDANEMSIDHGRTVFRIPEREAHQRGISDVKFSPAPGDFRFASVDVLGEMKLWQWEANGAPPREASFTSADLTIETPVWAEDFEQTSNVIWSDDATMLSAVRKGTLTLWKLINNQTQPVSLPMPEGFSTVFNCVDFSEDGQLLAAGGTTYNEEKDQLESFAILWRLDGDAATIVGTTDDRERHNYEARQKPFLRGITAIVIDDDQEEVVTGGADSQVIRWQIPIDEEDNEFGYISPREGQAADSFQDPHPSGITSLDISADGRLVSADEDGWIVIWPTLK